MYQSGTVLFLVLFIASAPAFAGDKGTANALTAKEASDGYLLLFDGETQLGWTAPDGSRWTVEEGVLKGPADKPGTLMTTTDFLDYELSFEYRLEKEMDGRLLVACAMKAKAPEFQALTLPTKGFTAGWVRATVKVQGGTIPQFLFRSEDNVNVSGERPFDDAKERGRLAFSGKNIVLRNIKLKPLNARSLFNGKDLTGWKVFMPAKYKSKFAVTDKGELNVKDGPGDIQTEGKFGDFVLQLECVSNGKHLNSGIFFRCKPNEYQNGYEAQIRNQFTAEATQDYVVEDYDPMTHKLVEKRKVKSAAVDFGTGSIYRRVPARKEASKDGAWFTLTLAAQGKHFATWVDGVQQVDWFDNRPSSDNPRTGFRAEAGHLSIQGHDPTTDLSFRNFRIVEMK